MKLLFTKSELTKAINIVLKAVPSRTTMPILECILIDATTDIIEFTANDMEIGIKTVVNGEILEKGKIAIDAKFFSEIIRKLPDNEITIESDSNFVTTILCEKAKFNIPAKAGDDFSYLPYIEKDKKIRISQFKLKETINQTIFCTTDKESNKMMGGEFFETEDNILKVVALDGHRIALRKVALEEDTDNIKAIVPSKTLGELSKILNDDNENFVEIYVTPNHILFEFDKTTVVSRLIEGEYFNVNQMITNSYETKVNVNKKELLSAIDRSTLLIKEGEKKPIILNVTDGNIEIKISSAIGSLDENIDIEKDGKDIMIGFNPRFIIDALRVIDDENVDLYLVNPKYPGIIKDTNETYIYLILPVNFVA